MTFLAIDIGGTKIRFGIGNGIKDWKFFEEILLKNKKNIDEIILKLENFLKKYRIKPNSFKGIGISFAGLIDKNKTVRIAENLNWTNIPLALLLEKKFKTKVFVETDVFCGAFFMLKAGEAKNLNSALYVSIGTGIGHAFIINREVWKGSNNNANAMGHTVVTQNGNNCYCGIKDCLCLVASGKAQSAVNPPEGATEALAKILGNSITLIEPEIIILSGGALNLKWFNLNKIKESIKKYTYPGARIPKIVKSSIDNVNLKGAALLIKENL